MLLPRVNYLCDFTRAFRHPRQVYLAPRMGLHLPKAKLPDMICTRPRVRRSEVQRCDHMDRPAALRMLLVINGALQFGTVLVRVSDDSHHNAGL